MRAIIPKAEKNKEKLGKYWDNIKHNIATAIPELRYEYTRRRWFWVDGLKSEKSNKPSKLKLFFINFNLFFIFKYKKEYWNIKLIYIFFK